MNTLRTVAYVVGAVIVGCFGAMFLTFPLAGVPVLRAVVALGFVAFMGVYGYRQAQRPTKTTAA